MVGWLSRRLAVERPTTVIALLLLNWHSKMAADGDHWSVYYNRDRPWIGMGDFETADLIEQNFGPICPRGQKIVSSMCRLTMAMQEFNQNTASHQEDHLEIPCTSKGLLCLNHQQQQRQHSTGQCNDYEIRFLCRAINDSDNNSNANPFPQFDVRIYIILAVVPIFIFLVRILWAYIFRRRRRQQRRAAGRRGRGDDALESNPDDDGGSEASALANPPPSYKELFGSTGPNRSSIFAISGRNVPICEQCKESACSVVQAVENSVGGSDSGTGVLAVSRSSSHSTQLTTDDADLSPSSSSHGIHSIAQDIDSVHVDLHNIITPGEQTSTQTQSEAARVPSTSNSPDPIQTGNPQLSTPVDVDHVVNCNNDAMSINRNNSRTAHATTDEGHSLQVHSAAQRRNSTLVPPSGQSPLSPCSSTSISNPCACVCHRTVPCNGRGVKGCINNAYHVDNPSQSSNLRGGHAPLPRAWSNLSTLSAVTLTELPSYQDALELIQTKEAEATRTDN